MTQQIINLGTGINTKDGDNIRLAFSKVNENFSELYTTVGPSIIPDTTGNNGKYLSTDGTALIWVDIVDDDSTYVTSASLSTTLLPYITETELSTALSSAASTHLTNGVYEVDLTYDGKLTLPLSANGKSVIKSNGNLQIVAGAYTYTFGNNGNIILPPDGQIKYNDGTTYGGGTSNFSLLIDGGSPTSVFDGSEIVVDGGTP
jgi:hypothetical protein